MATASAGTDGLAQATARAKLGDEILQFAQNGSGSYAKIYNDADFAIGASAFANDDGGLAYAFAAITVSGIYQSATGGYNAQATLTNDSAGALTIEPFASASGRPPMPRLASAALQRAQMAFSRMLRQEVTVRRTCQ